MGGGLGRDEFFWAEMAAVASAAGDGCAGAIDFGDVVRVDVFGHFEHDAGGLLFFLGVVGEVQYGLAVGAGFLGIDGVAGLAAGAEFAGPLVHDFVNLLACQVARQDFEIGGGGHFVGRTLRSSGRGRGLSCGEDAGVTGKKICDEDGGGQNCGGGSGGQNEAGNSHAWESFGSRLSWDRSPSWTARVEASLHSVPVGET